MEKQVRKKHQGFSLGDGQFEMLMRAPDNELKFESSVKGEV